MTFSVSIDILNIEIKKDGNKVAEEVINMRTITLNGVDFEVSRKALDIEPIRYMGRNLDECYERPSNKKREIWCEWVNYFS